MSAGNLMRIAGIGAVVIVFIAGCASPIQRNPVPEDLVDVAQVKDLSDIRYWGDSQIDNLDSVMLESRWDEMGKRQQHYLALSGGGDNGAYGAGFLNGWTAAGTRPEFTLVTGISTGALIAPFAFLGSKYDDKIKYFYTEYSAEDLIKKRSLFSIRRNASAVDPSGLREKIEQFIDEDVMEEISVEYGKGRLLNIGTANLDTGRSVVWSIGRIAASGDPQALGLIHDIIMASASLGGIFPPVLIEVEANGTTYDEMHVDGGTSNQLFVYPLALDWGKVMERANVKEPPHVYLIRNAKLTPHYSPASYDLFDIIGHSVNSLIRTQGLGDLDHIFLKTQRDNLEFYLTYIPNDFTESHDGEFDNAYMRKLYALGYERGLSEAPWERSPPGYDISSQVDH